MFLVQMVLVQINKGIQLKELEYQILGTYTLQGSLIGMLIFLRINFPNQYGPPLNKEDAQSGWHASLHALMIFLKYLPLIWLATVLSQLLFQFLGVELEQQKPVEVLLRALEKEPSKFWALAFGAIVLAPIAEELLFRSYIYRFLKSKFTTSLATIISALLFAAMHNNVASLVPLFVLGVLFTRTYENTGSIVAPMVYHALFNASSILLIFMTPYFPEMQ